MTLAAVSDFEATRADTTETVRVVASDDAYTLSGRRATTTGSTSAHAPSLTLLP